MIPTRSHLSKYWIVTISLLGLLLISANPSSYWQLSEGRLVLFDHQELGEKQTFLEPKLTGDLDDDGDVECVEMSGEGTQITDCASEVFWQSPSEWRVREAQIADLNHDGSEEVVLLVWRPFRPWPVDQFMPSGGRINDHHDSQDDSCQLILVGWVRDAWRELWAGSALARPVEQLGVADLDGDGWQELAAFENDYDSNIPGGQLTVWRWIGFSFSLVDRTESRWERLAIMGDGVHYWLFTR